MDEDHQFSDEEDYNSDLDNMDEVDTEKDSNTSKDSKRLEKDTKKKEDEDENEEECEIDENEEEVEENIEDDEDDEDNDIDENAEDDVILDEGTSDDLVEYIVKEEDRITSDCLSKYEMIELINIRATQISKGDYPFTDVKNLRDPISMAKKEIYDNKCPLLVKRGIGNNKFEVWNPNLMLKPKI